MTQKLHFIESSPTIENQWRAIILFGRNTASYKFSLAKSLLENPELLKKGNVSLQDLALPYAMNICTHLKENDRQITASSSKFLDACRGYNDKSIDIDSLIQSTVSLGFNNVLDAFHIVNQANIPDLFFEKSQDNKSIVITDSLLELLEDPRSITLSLETEARWRLVETAWRLNLAKQLITVHHDTDNELLYTLTQHRRTNITSCRDSLNGYQKGVCFYCFDNITIEQSSDLLADVDHFLPHTLKSSLYHASLDGVWNLVLACQNCNRGTNGKFARIPSLPLLERLAKRNEYLIFSHHPLRETLIQQTGNTPQQRNKFLQHCYNIAKKSLIHSWEPAAKKNNLIL